MPPSDSLDAHDIYFTNEETPESSDTCPAELRDVFKLVANVRDLKFDHFGGFEKTTSGASLIAPNPRQQYEKELKNEAIQLAADCNDKRRPDDIESKWVQTLAPVVFYRFDREQEERFKRDRHQHCFICRKHYPVRSRPLISRTSERGTALKVEKWSEDKKEDQCTEHFNLPNFDTAQQLAYPKFEDELKKIPDLTIGLLSYDPNDWSDSVDIRLLQDDRVRLFDQKLLRKLEGKGQLKVPFIRPGSSKRVTDMCLTFPFGFWEAKREGGSYDHQSAQKQNSLKIKMILGWQDEIGKRAEVPWVPLVWYFVSVGSKFEVHGCHFEQSLFSRKCVLRKLWSGDCTNIDKALQLLYLVDIIALWGEHRYKPFAGACIRRLQAKVDNETRPPLQDTLLARQLDINKDTFPWLFEDQITRQGLAASHIADRQGSSKPRSQSQSRSQNPQSTQLLQEIKHLSLTSNDSDYIIPERDCFIWILDRDPGRQDLLVVRIGVDGSRLQPLIIFNSTSWDEEDFQLVIEEEQARLPKGILADFRLCQDGRSFLKSSIARNPGYFRKSNSQFCAIIPLDSKIYQRLRRSEDAGHAVFEQFERLLGLPELIQAAQDANERWCQCQAIYNEHSPNMILCDNVKCRMGWYHKRCVGLGENFRADCWLCKQCLNKWHEIDRTWIESDSEDDIDEDIRKASDYRIQRIKTLARVWEDHEWPNAQKIRRRINEISCRININESITYNTVKEMRARRGDKSRCWAIERLSPKVMRPIRSAEGSFPRGTDRDTQNLGHRKPHQDLSTIAATGSGVQERPPGQLAVPQWRDHGRRKSDPFRL